jgi:hypothetical protein
MQIHLSLLTVTVTADADMTSRNSATIVRELDAHELENLPTSSRNFTQLLLIEPGVSADISELLSNNNASISPSVNGARTTNNSFVFNAHVTSMPAATAARTPQTGRSTRAAARSRGTSRRP